MNHKISGVGRGARAAALNSSFGTAVDSDLFYAAWMRAACAQGKLASETPHPAPRTPHASHTPAERRRLHPSVVSRLRLAQRFSRRELKDVPHA